MSSDGSYLSQSDVQITIQQCLTSLAIFSAAFATHLVIGFITLYTLYHAYMQGRPHAKKQFALTASMIVLGCINFSGFTVGINVVARNAIAANDTILPQAPLIIYVADSAAFVISVVAQSYLVYRCFLIWERKVLIGIIYTLCALCVFALGLFNIIIQPETVISAGAKFRPMWILNSTITWYWATSLALNVSMTILIVSRLLWMRSKVRAALGPSHAKIYASIAAVIAESSLLYSVVIGLGFFALPGPLVGSDHIFSPLLAQTEAIAAELVVLRFTFDRIWSGKTLRTVEMVTASQLRAQEEKDIHVQLPMHHNAPPHEGSVQFATLPSTIEAILQSHS